MQNKMKNKFKRFLIEALRSDQYKQGKHQLYNPKTNSYCCLGVLCKISNLKQDKEAFIYKNKRETLVLPKYFRKKVNLSNKNQRKLTEMNDTGKSFNQIANWIEEHL